MSRQFWQEAIVWATGDGTTFNTTATETIIFPNSTIPANMFQDGRSFRISAFGRYSNVVTAVPDLHFSVRIGGVGGVLVCRTPLIRLSAAAVTSATWSLDVVMTVRTNGSSGTVFGMGNCTVQNGISPVMGTVANYGVTVVMGSTGGTVPVASAAIDFTVDQALSVTGKFSASDAANGITGHILVIESLN